MTDTIACTAAQICLTAPPLLGVDLAPGFFRFVGMTSERMIVMGLQARHGWVLSALEAGLHADAVRSFVHCEGTHGQDRLYAIWWHNFRALVFRYRQCAIHSAEEHWRLLGALDKPAEDLFRDGVISEDARDLLGSRGATFERKEILAFSERLRKTAEGA